MATLGAALARGFANYAAGRQERMDEDYRRAQIEQQRQRQERLDEENRMRQAEQMRIAAETLAMTKANNERQTQRETMQDQRNAYEGGYRSLAEAQQQGAVLGTAGAALQNAPLMGGAGVGLQQYADAMRTQREAFTMGGTPMAKVAESVRERENRMEAQQREGEAIQARQARAKEQADDRAFQLRRDRERDAAMMRQIGARQSAAAQPPAPRTLPMGVEAAISENATVLGAIEQAEQMMAGGKGEGAFGRGVGIKRTLGLERWGAKPEDQELAAIVGNVASQQIKLRSGAAVTAAEWPRLRPFLPVLDGPGADDRATVLRKLAKMREIIAAETNARADYYEAQGYAVPTIPGRAPRGGDVRRDRPAGGPMDDPDFVNFLRSKGITP